MKIERYIPLSDSGKCCPTCGHPTAPTLLSLIFKGQQRKIYEAVARAGNVGIGSERLVDAVYAHRADGGPDTGHKVIHVQICKQINPRLKRYGLKIYAGQGAGGNPYRLRLLE